MRTRHIVTLILPLLLCLSGCGSPSKPTTDDGPETTDAFEFQNTTVRVSGPYSHENVSVFLIHAEKQDDRNFLTLDDGLTNGQVKVTELEQETVRELLVENTSDQALFLQEGERLYGGKQDRIIAASLVLPPRSGKVGVPTFCIERSRWVEGDQGRKFVATKTTALAPKGVRGAAKFENDQDGIWSTVATQKDSATKQDLAKNTNSSANELLDAPKLQKLSSACAAALVDAAKDHADAIGVAVVVNGQVEEVNMYPNNAVLGKFLPRLVQSYAIQAEMLKVTNPDTKQTTASDVANLLTSGKELSKQSKTINTANAAILLELEGHKHVSATRYEGTLVHWQMMKKNRVEPAAAPARAVLGGKW